MAKSSPFEVIYERLGANFSEYDGWRLPKDFGDAAAERKGLLEGSAAFDLSSFGRILVTGAGGWGLLDRLLAGSGEEMAIDKWAWSVICRESGGGYVVRLARTNKGYIVFTMPAETQSVLSLLQAGADGESGGVKVVDITEQTALMGIYGPKAVGAVDRILPFDVSKIEPFCVLSISVFMMKITIIRGSWVGLDGLELLCPASAAVMAGGAVAKYHKQAGIVPAGMLCLQNAMAIAEMGAKRL
jgi:aminomethyltransferase